MFRITEDPSSGSLIQCLAKITVMVLSCLLTWTWSVLWQHGWIRNDASVALIITTIIIVVAGILVLATSHYVSRSHRRLLLGGQTANPIIQQGITTF